MEASRVETSDFVIIYSLEGNSHATSGFRGLPRLEAEACTSIFLLRSFVTFEVTFSFLVT